MKKYGCTVFVVFLKYFDSCSPPTYKWRSIVLAVNFCFSPVCIYILLKEYIPLILILLQLQHLHLKINLYNFYYPCDREYSYI